MTKITVNKGQTNQRDYDVLGCTIGSAKQIEWADKIKTSVIGDLFMIISQPGGQAKVDQVIKYSDMLNVIVDSTFWIDHKNDSWKEIVKSL